MDSPALGFFAAGLLVGFQLTLALWVGTRADRQSNKADQQNEWSE